MGFLLSRYTSFVICLLLAAAGLGLVSLGAGASGWVLLVVGGGLSLVGVRDLVQRRHSIQRNYPVIGHVRWMAELIRPEIRQYLVEADTDAAPFSRIQRSLVYERAKGQTGERPFGTLLDVYGGGYEFIGHSTCPVAAADPAGFRVTVGGDLCAKPYSASVFNISAMSFGALSANAIRALNAGRQARRLLPRHRRGQHQPLSPRSRRRHRLGDRPAAISAAATPTAGSIPTGSPRRPAPIR